MSVTSVRELHIRTSALVRDAADAATIVIERRGLPVAELRPLSGPPVLSTAARKKIFDRMEKYWAKQLRLPIDSTAIIENDRDR